MASTQNYNNRGSSVLSQNFGCGMLKNPQDEIIEAVLETLGPHFMEATHQGRLNTDIASMIFAWGMELNEEVVIIKWVMSSLFDEELLGKMESLVEWAVPGQGYDVSEGIEDMDEATEEGLLPFVRWRKRVDREEYKISIFIAWEHLKFVL